jgi:hypothetical protein
MAAGNSESEGYICIAYIAFFLLSMMAVLQLRTPWDRAAHYAGRNQQNRVSDMQAINDCFQRGLFQRSILAKDLSLNLFCNCSNSLEVMPNESDQGQLRELMPCLCCTLLAVTCIEQNIVRNRRQSQHQKLVRAHFDFDKEWTQSILAHIPAPSSVVPFIVPDASSSMEAFTASASRSRTRLNARSSTSCCCWMASSLSCRLCSTCKQPPSKALISREATHSKQHGPRCATRPFCKKIHHSTHCPALYFLTVAGLARTKRLHQPLGLAAGSAGSGLVLCNAIITDYCCRRLQNPQHP